MEQHFQSVGVQHALCSELHHANTEQLLKAITWRTEEINKSSLKIKELSSSTNDDETLKKNSS